ncbi:MAG: hypothetical protein JWO21_564 [Solirubrobacterales bacterium]|jgi:hypothetical protein|nr:hypothetical protein [Solirubrobacterales bacterium]
MSPENVDLVLSVQPARDVDIAQLFRREGKIASKSWLGRPQLHPRLPKLR